MLDHPQVVLSLLVPLYNEARSVKGAVDRAVEAGRSLGIAFEVVAVDDGSRDGTIHVLQSLDHPELRILDHAQNRGLGAALRTAMEGARGQFCIVCPADSPPSPWLLERFMAAAEHADLVLGYRPQRLGYSSLMRVNSWLYHMVLRTVCGLSYRDVNWIHLYRRSCFVDYVHRFSGIVAAAETVLAARARGCRIVEIECPMEARAHGRASASRPSVMLRTAADLLRLLWCWRELR